MVRIDKKTYQVSEINRYKNKTVKTQIVIGFSLRKDNYHILRLQNKDYGKSKRWNTYTISRKGTVYQHYDDSFHSNFLNIKIGDKQSISIVLENMSSLIHTDGDKYVSWLNESCPKKNVVEKEWFGYYFWEKIPEIQLNNLVLLCKKMCEKHNIPKTCIDFNTYHKNINKFKGIVFRSNYIEDSNDINPLIDIELFNKQLGTK